MRRNETTKVYPVKSFLILSKNSCFLLFVTISFLQLKSNLKNYEQHIQTPLTLFTVMIEALYLGLSLMGCSESGTDDDFIIRQSLPRIDSLRLESEVNLKNCVGTTEFSIADRKGENTKFPTPKYRIVSKKNIEIYVLRKMVCTHLKIDSCLKICRNMFHCTSLFDLYWRLQVMLLFISKNKK